MSDLSEELRVTQEHLFRADSKLHRLWFYLREPYKNQVAELRHQLEAMLAVLEELRDQADSPASSEWEEGEEWKEG